LKLAIFGGTFDPIHNAHLEIARAAVEAASLDCVLFVPAAHPPHKQGVTHASYADRLQMIELAIAGEPRFRASRLEESDVRSYSIDTIERVRATLAPQDVLFFLIGADAFAEIRTWHRWKDVVRAVRFIVVTRPGWSYKVPEHTEVVQVADVLLPLSSSEIRRILARGRHPDGLPDAVAEYAIEHRLYR
jgi:nicotinate-nucleotide adenylyltransferase